MELFGINSGLEMFVLFTEGKLQIIILYFNELNLAVYFEHCLGSTKQVNRRLAMT